MFGWYMKGVLVRDIVDEELWVDGGRRSRGSYINYFCAAWPCLTEVWLTPRLLKQRPHGEFTIILSRVVVECLRHFMERAESVPA